MFLKIISFDLEVLPLRNQMPTPDKCPILLISNHFNFDYVVGDKKVRNIVLILTKEDSENGKIEFSGDDGNRLVFYLKDEKVMLEKLFDLMRRCDVIIGYNINGFDIPYIFGSTSRMGDVSYVKGRWSVLGGKGVNIGNGDKRVFCDSIVSKDMRTVKVGNILGKIVFDVMYLLRREDESNIFKKEYNLKNVTLKHVSKEILNIEKLEFSPEEMIDYWNGVHGVVDKEIRNKFSDYCSRDSQLALMFVTKYRLLDRFIMMSRRSGKVLQAAIDSLGSGILVENLLLPAYRAEDRVMSCRKKVAPEKIKLLGAFVREPRIGLDEYLISLDYKCCVGDTLILTSKGFTKIKDIENEENISVNSFKDGGDFDIKKIIDFKNIGIDNTKRVTLEYGYELEGSVNHRVLSVDNGSPKFVELKDLKIDNVVVLNKTSNIYGSDVVFNYLGYDIVDIVKEGQYGSYRNIIFKNVCEILRNNIILPDKVDCDFSEFFGYMVSDGYVGSDNDNLGFTQKDENVFNRFKELYDIVFKKKEITSKQQSLGGWFGLENIEIEERYRYELRYRYKGGHEVTVSSIDLKRLFKYYGFSGNSYQKEVPWCILQSSKECQCSFIMTLFEGDGCANNADGTKYNRLHYLSKSKKLCSQVQTMLLNMGIMSHLYYIKSSNDYRLEIRGYNIVLFNQNIGFVSDRKNLRTKNIVDNVMGCDYIDSDEIDFDKISKKDRAGNQFPIEVGLNETLKSLHTKYVEIGHTGNIHSCVNKKDGYVSHMDDPSFFRAIYRYINNNDNINITVLKKYLKIVEGELSEDIDFRKLKWFTECNMVFLRVQNIEDGLENLYDISIDETHNYISNGFISHNSLYPSLMIKHNICYSTVIKDDMKIDESKVLEMKDEMGNVYGKFIKKEVYTGIVPRLLMGLLSERATLKKELKKYDKGTPEYILYDASQQAVKILLNSFYGYSGDNKAKLYYWTVATAVTANGRIQIMKTIDMIENDINTIEFEGRKFKLSVVIADTDSSYVKISNVDGVDGRLVNKGYDGIVRVEDAMYCAEKIMEYVNSRLERPMELAFENYINRIVIVAKKRYAMVVEDSSGKKSIISKGIESVRRDYCNYATENLSDIIDYVLMENDVKIGIDKSIQLIKDEARKLKKGEVKPEDLALSNKLTKAITAYDNLEPHVQVAIKQKERGFPYQEGDRVQYLIIDNGKTLVGERAEDYNYVIKKGLKIDYNYYLNNQFLPSAIKILELLGVKKEVLMVGLDEGQKSLKEWFF